MQQSQQNPQQSQQIGQTTNDFDEDGITFEVIEEEQTESGKIKRKGVYLLPNLITTTALFCGFYSIISSTNGQYLHAIYAIALAALLDGLDGRVARAMNAQSAFGEQFDSLSDLLAFGVAPAILMYSWSLDGLGRIGLACCFVYTACAAFRLARFNVQIGVVDKKYFIGVASPLAAIMVICWVYVQYDEALSQSWVLLSNAIIMVIIGLLMVSNLKYYSFKVMDKKRVPFVLMIPVVFILMAISYNIPLGILTICVLYALSGIATTLMCRNSGTCHK